MLNLRRLYVCRHGVPPRRFQHSSFCLTRPLLRLNQRPRLLGQTRRPLSSKCTDAVRWDQSRSALVVWMNAAFFFKFSDFRHRTEILHYFRGSSYNENDGIDVRTFGTKFIKFLFVAGKHWSHFEHMGKCMPTFSNSLRPHGRTGGVPTVSLIVLEVTNSQLLDKEVCQTWGLKHHIGTEFDRLWIRCGSESGSRC